MQIALLELASVGAAAGTESERWTTRRCRTTWPRAACAMRAALDIYEARPQTAIAGWTVVDGRVIRTSARPRRAPARSDAQVQASAAAARVALDHLDLPPAGRRRAAELLSRPVRQPSLFGGW